MPMVPPLLMINTVGSVAALFKVFRMGWLTMHHNWLNFKSEQDSFGCIRKIHSRTNAVLTGAMK
jgi:hypothetical protein